MAKKIRAVIKLQLPAGQATPAPPVGPALGAHGVPIGEFVNQFNAATADQRGMIIPVVVTVYKDRSFTLEYKSPPAAVLLRKAAGVTKGAAHQLQEVAGTVTKAQIREIAKVKLPDLNTNDVDEAMKTVEGTARSMGIEVK